MKKLIIFFSLISVMMTHAQNQRFIYEYKYVIDSTAKDKPETEIMLLDVAPKGSKFYSKDNFESDSLMRAAMEKQFQAGSTELNFSGIKFKGKIRYSVEKMYPDYAVNFFNNLAADEYMVQDSRKQEWKILQDKEKIGAFTAQKAICNFAGRKWTAWFTTDLPIQDGPYKFSGLPGLIVKLEDATRSHSFELKGNKKLPGGYEWKSSKEKERFNPLITVNETKYKKAFKDYLADPMKGERQMLAQGVIIQEIDDSGKTVDRNTVEKAREAKQKNDLKKENNIIELDLLK
ncbi:GLPGLI family protein [Chryseobacterium sp. Tr-659]|uniref:GLPGLI family protein n=1 Tax=Chryseobacterium sp. Tr-659 TaxID=2608340 RepID=UPI00141EA9AC|nr:GLPGLI family protein [Chryseobacterium sp. Tr-659]NIF04880.1 GLPGLI family protein [Chryseobacterium sp. Tr-659]